MQASKIFVLVCSSLVCCAFSLIPAIPFAVTANDLSQTIDSWNWFVRRLIVAFLGNFFVSKHPAHSGLCNLKFSRNSNCCFVFWLQLSTVLSYTACHSIRSPLDCCFGHVNFGVNFVSSSSQKIQHIQVLQTQVLDEIELLLCFLIDFRYRYVVAQSCQDESNHRSRSR